MKTDRYYRQKNDSSGSIEFTNVQIVHKFAGQVTSNLHFKVTVFFNNVKYLENCTRQSYTYNDRRIGSCV